MQITEEQFATLHNKLGAMPAASKLESLLAEIGVTVTKPMIINGIECPQPQRKPLPIGQEYFLADPTVEDMYSGSFIWSDDNGDNMWLERGLVFLNKEDAIKVTTAFLIPLTAQMEEN